MRGRTSTLIVFSATAVVGGVVAFRVVLDQFLATRSEAAPLAWSGPIRGDLDGIPQRLEEPMNGDDFAVSSWTDDRDAAIGSVDITGIGLVDPVGQIRRLHIELAVLPPRQLPALGVIAYGVTIDTTGDGMPDWILGIDNRAPIGQHRAWRTDLATGETIQRVGAPYGDPFDSWYPGEAGALAEPRATFSLDVARNVSEIQFYAWASVTAAGEVISWDYAPNDSWIVGSANP